MEWIPVLVVVLSLVVFYFISQKSQSAGVTNEFLMQLNAQLREEIQGIRKETDANAKETRVELEQKLDNITKGISDYQRSSNQSIAQQFTESKKGVLEKYKGSGLVWIEDRVDYAIDGDEMGLKTYMMDWPYNREYEGRRVSSWKEIYDATH